MRSIHVLLDFFSNSNICVVWPSWIFFIEWIIARIHWVLLQYRSQQLLFKWRKLKTWSYKAWHLHMNVFHLKAIQVSCTRSSSSRFENSNMSSFCCSTFSESVVTLCLTLYVLILHWNKQCKLFFYHNMSLVFHVPVSCHFRVIAVNAVNC